MSETTTGYAVVIPEGATTLESKNGDEVNELFENLPDVLYTAETATHYGVIEWPADEEVTSVVIDGSDIPVEVLIGGYHKPPPTK